MSEPKSEFRLIEWIRNHSDVPADHVIAGIGDDMAVMQLADQQLLITTDMLLDGVHFDLSHCTFTQAGYKALACSLSDCAAMAAVPFAAVVAVALPQNTTMPQARQLHEGIHQLALQYHCPIVGGDTTSWNKPLAIDVTVLARMEHGQPIFRHGAKIGDAVLITGRLGGAQAGKHLTFTPRIAEAQTLTQLVQLHAMIDISDGLSSDLAHICNESKVAAAIEADTLPLSDAARAAADPLAAALHDGEDFELLFCVSPADAEKLHQQWSQHSTTPLTRIGRIIEKPQADQRLFLQQADGALQPLDAQGWEHFRD